jgi:hypothetical protein
MMAKYNPDLMQLDDGEATVTRRTPAQASDTTPMTDAEVREASIAAAVELGVDPAVIEAERKAAQLAAIKAAREERQTSAAEERASSDPLKDFNNRPDAQTASTSDYIVYYSWIGGRTTGEWKPYRVPRSEDNMAAYGARAVGGPTKASITGNVADANGLTVQPTPIKDNEGQITGWEINGESSANRIPTGGNDGAGAVGTVDGSGRTVVSRVEASDSVTVTYSDGTKTTFMKTGATGVTGRTGGVSGAGTGLTFTASDGKTFTDQQAYVAYQANLANQKAERQSAYDLLYSQFNQYGLGSLVTPLRELITSGASPSEFTIKLRESDAYKRRFSANSQRIAKGLAAISEAEYLGLEDQYQNIMRNYGLPAEYYARGEMGIQEGFNKFIANDVSAAELEDRVMTAQSRVLNANPEVLASLKAFYPDITNGDILAYTLNPEKALIDIKRKVTSAEIGGGAMQAGLGITGTRAEELTAAGITKQQAQQGFGTIAGGLERGSQLASIYGENPYTQTTAEKEVFGLAGKTEAEKERKKLTGLEKATFSGQTGLTSGALARDRAGAY